jgi:tetratricopeptide (TPR) repeat protein
VAERLRARRTTRHLAALGAAETELDNFREALDWAIPADGGPGGDLSLALRLCGALGWVWWAGGYVAEGKHWYDRVITRADGSPSPALAACTGNLADLLLSQGQFDEAHDLADRSLSMARVVGDEDSEGFALVVLGTTQLQRGQLETARSTLEQATDLHRRRGAQGLLARALGHLGGIEEESGNYDRAEELIVEALAIFDTLGDVHSSVVQRQNLANLLVVAGQAERARAVAVGLIDTVLELRNPSLTMAFANTWMNILIRLGDPEGAARVFGAEEAMHARLALPNPHQDEELEEALDLVADVMTREEWDRHRRLGQAVRVEDLLLQLRAEAAQPGADR